MHKRWLSSSEIDKKENVEIIFVDDDDYAVTTTFFHKNVLGKAVKMNESRDDGDEFARRRLRYSSLMKV